MTFSDMKDIQQYIQDGKIDFWDHGNVKVIEKDNLILLNYTNKAVYANEWNYLERVSRGLILNRNTGEIVARPFDRMFNWGEGGRYNKSSIVTVTEKVDGSLGILFQHRGKFRIATRGSFDSEQAYWATEYFNKRLSPYVPNDFTLLFEIIYPANRVVVNYEGYEGLYLLAARNRFTGKYMQHSDLEQYAEIESMDIVPIWPFNTIDQILKQLPDLDTNQEGWVAEMSDETRWKFKGDRYVALHKLISNLSFKSTAKAVKENRIDELINVIPNEFLGDFHRWVNDIVCRCSELDFAIAEAFEMAPKSSRKEFAIWVNGDRPELAAYLFKRYDSKPYRDLLFKREYGI